MRIGLSLMAAFALSVAQAQAVEFDFSGYVDARVIAAPEELTWVKGGLDKVRFGPNHGTFRFVEAVGQLQASFDQEFSAVLFSRLEPTDSAELDFLEAYALSAPRSTGTVSGSLKVGAFFPTISLENDDIGWQSPYTITPSAINTWIGEEPRTIGGEGKLRWNGGDAGSFSLIGTIICRNDETGILMADRG